MQEKFVRDALIILTTIDPIGTLALFAALTHGMVAKRRRATALKATLYSAAVLLGAIVIGQILLTAMGIRLVSLQLSGGIILFLFGLQMIFGHVAPNQANHDESVGVEPGHDVAVFPLTIPSIASPGAIMAVILLTDNQLHDVTVQVGTALIVVAVLAFTYLLMRLSGVIIRLIGINGSAILIRLMGMILSALSIELVMNALNISRWMTTSPS